MRNFSLSVRLLATVAGGFEALSKDAAQMDLFHYGAVIPWKADGEFKFASVTDFGQADAFFHPTMANAPYTSTSVVLGGDDDTNGR